MFVVAITALLGLISVLYSLQFSGEAPKNNAVFVQNTTQNMLTYKQAANSYHSANPTATGVIADASLTVYLPANYYKNANWIANRSGNYTYVYTSDVAITNAPGMSSSLSKETGNSLFAGKNVGGTLFSSSRGSTGITLPAFIPNGSLVVMGN